jgi:hypothetical protein
MACQQPLLSRDAYAPYDLDSGSWKHLFDDEYRKALKEESVWVKDAEAVALRVSGYPREEGATPESVRSSIVTSEVGVYFVTSRDLLDDSIQKKEVRIELTRSGYIWSVAWAGVRQQCRRSLFPLWTTNACP